jgi:hypothetical protein
VLDWLTRHPTPEVLAEVVKMWARERPDGAGEQRFRQVVERISGTGWQQALLDGLAAASFSARGSALEVLRGRLGEAELRRRILAIRPQSEAMVALQLFLRRFNYLPPDSEAFLTIVMHATHRRELIDDAARLYRRWAQDHGYRFRLRDVHLLSRLARDPLRQDLARTQLVLEVGQAVNARQHVNRATRPAGGAGTGTENFWERLEDLSVADLWRLYLLNEMLSRPRIQMALRRMARLDRDDTRRAWGGLVFYENGQAEAKLYPGGENPAAPWRYVPNPDCLVDERDSLCRFHAHFGRVDNVTRAGPTADELQQAREHRYTALVLTSLDPEHFCAHYYNAEGSVVSLGIFPYRP